MWHKPCRTFHPWCPCIKTRCLFVMARDHFKGSSAFTEVAKKQDKPPLFGDKFRGVITGLLPDRQNCGLRMRRECRERFSPPPTSKKPLVSDPGMLHGTCVTHVPWCMSGSLAPRGGENVPSIPGACATRNFTYLARGPLNGVLCPNTWRRQNGSLICLVRGSLLP